MPLGSISEWRSRIGSSWCALGRPFKTRSPFRGGGGQLQTPLTLNQVVTMTVILMIFTAINIAFRIVWTTGHYHACLGLITHWVFENLVIIGPHYLYQSFCCIIITSPWLIVVLQDLSWKPIQQKNDSEQRTFLQFMYVVVTLLETAQSIIASTPIIFYRLLQSGDVEQNPGPDIDYDAIDSEKVLDENNLFDVMEELGPLNNTRFYYLGIGLRLTVSELDSIESSFQHNPQRALTKVVTAWLQKHYSVDNFGPPTWKMLVKAVNSPAGGNDHSLAQKIASNHPAKGSSTGTMKENTETAVSKDDDVLKPCNIKEVLDQMWEYRARWKFIGIELGIGEHSLDAIEANYPRNVDDCLREMIHCWLKNVSPRPTRRAMRVALQSKSVSNTAAITHNKKSEVTDDKLEEYTGYLKSLYKAKTQASFSGDDQWPPPVTNKVFSLAMIKPEQVQRRNIDDHFVRETITGKIDDILQRKVPITLEEIFGKGEQQKTKGAPGGGESSTLSEDERKKMLIEGAPGCGKSTLSLQICHEWIAGRLLKEYSQVVLVKLREKTVQNAKNIADLLPKRNDTMGQNVEEEINARDGEGVLFILDGWDELPEKAPGRLIIQNILDCKKLHKSSVVITSRPISSMNLHKLVNTRIEILGFTKDELQKYFTECLGNDRVKVKELQQRIKENPVVEGSCYLPLNASILVHLFKCDGVLPLTQFGIFSALICNCIFRHLKKKNEQLDIPGIKSLDKLPTAIQRQLEHICEIAYKGVIEDQITFDLERSFNTLGLLQGVESFASGMPSHSYNFLHLSIQELLAAIHMATKLKSSEQVEQFQELFGRARFSAVFQFYAAKTKLKTQGMDEIVIQVVQKCMQDKKATEFTPHSGTNSDQSSGSSSLGHKPQPLLLSLLHCLFEAQDETLCQLVVKELKGKLRGLEDISLNPADCLSAGYFLTHCRQFEVYLGGCSIGDDECKALFRKGQKYDLRYLDLGIDGLGNKSDVRPRKTIISFNAIGDVGRRALEEAAKGKGTRIYW